MRGKIPVAVARVVKRLRSGNDAVLAFDVAKNSYVAMTRIPRSIGLELIGVYTPAAGRNDVCADVTAYDIERERNERRYVRKS